jgi:hypothetical protein
LIAFGRIDYGSRQEEATMDAIRAREARARLRLACLLAALALPAVIGSGCGDGNDDDHFQRSPLCGNGVLDPPGEACDDPRNPQICTDDCRQRCGSGVCDLDEFCCGPIDSPTRGCLPRDSGIACAL